MESFLLCVCYQNEGRIFLFFPVSYITDPIILTVYGYQVLGLLVEVMTKDIREHITSILHVAKGILEASIHAASNKGLDIMNEPAIPLWKEAYYSLIMLEKMLQYFPELYFERNLEV